jgi:hypothetical protein
MDETFARMTSAQRRRFRSDMTKKAREFAPNARDHQLRQLVDLCMGIPLDPETEAKMREVAVNTAARGETEELRSMFVDYLAATGPSGRG